MTAQQLSLSGPGALATGRRFGLLDVHRLFWYAGLAKGGVARVGQIQLLQPFLTLAGGALMLGEPLDAAHPGLRGGRDRRRGTGTPRCRA